MTSAPNKDEEIAIRPSDSAKRWLADKRAQKEKGNFVLNPQTPPQRFTASTYSSPGSILGKEEDAVVIQLSERHLLAGVEGESDAQCKISFHPNGSRRIGDYRQWLTTSRRQEEDIDTWGKGYELWRSSTANLDLGLLGDRLERAIREAYNRHLLVDAGSGRLVIVLPSLVPHPVLDAIIGTFFERWPYPSITLLPEPLMSAVAAGLRSALVVNIGWEEVCVTPIYEYRELPSCYSTRAMRFMTRRAAIALQNLRSNFGRSNSFTIDLGFVEDILVRSALRLTVEDPSIPSEEEHTKGDMPGQYVEWVGTTASERIEIPNSILIAAVNETFFDTASNVYEDDHELAIPQLIFKALVALSTDVRSACMPRVVFTGDCKVVPDLRSRALRGVEDMIKKSGWSLVRGQHLRERRAGLSEIAQLRTEPADAKFDNPIPAGKDYVEKALRTKKSNTAYPPPSTGLREVISLGAWAGASLLTSLKVRGFVEIDRERFLHHGLSGASRDTNISVVPQPQRMSSFGIPKPAKSADKTSWTLAGWG